MVKTNKPYQRPETYRKANPDAPGAWKHDLHQSVKQSLASRISSNSSPSGSTASSRSSHPSLLSRMSGGIGKELLPTGKTSNRAQGGMQGFDQPLPVNLNNANAGVELLPSGGRRPKNSGRGVDAQSRELVNAALGVGPQRFREPVRPNQRELTQPQFTQSPLLSQPPQQQQVSIMGAARGTTWVRVENLAVGTTAEDVVSAFAPVPVLNAKPTSPTNPNTVTVDLELEQRSDAEGLIIQYDGVVADGNKLAVTIINQSLKSRIGVGPTAGAASRGADNGRVIQPAQPSKATSAGRELPGGPSSGKLYSDTVLASNPSSSIITLADGTTMSSGEAAAAARRSDAWKTSGPSLASRMGGQGSRGRGQARAGVYGGMMID